MNQFFEISANIRRSLYAPQIINDKDAFLDNCKKCGRTRFNEKNKVLKLAIEGKGKFPDTLLCGHYPLFIISNFALEEWQKYGVTGLTQMYNIIM